MSTPKKKRYPLTKPELLQHFFPTKSNIENPVEQHGTSIGSYAGSALLIVELTYSRDFKHSESWYPQLQESPMSICGRCALRFIPESPFKTVNRMMAFQDQKVHTSAGLLMPSCQGHGLQVRNINRMVPLYIDMYNIDWLKGGFKLHSNSFVIPLMLIGKR